MIKVKKYIILCFNIFLSKPENKVGSKRSILWAGEHKMIVAEISTRRKQALSLKRWLGMQGRHGARAVTGQGRPEAGADTDAGQHYTPDTGTRQTRTLGNLTAPPLLQKNKNNATKCRPRNLIRLRNRESKWKGWGGKLISGKDPQ